MIIKDFDNYEISTQGKIKNIKTGKYLKGSINTHGYLTVRIKNNNGYFITKTIHGLMAKTFLKYKENNLVVDHIDGNKLNNDIKNLELVTSKENTVRAFKNGLIKTRKDNSEHSKKKVTATNIENKEVVEFLSITDCMKYLGYKSIPGSWLRRSSDSILLRGYVIKLKNS